MMASLNRRQFVATSGLAACGAVVAGSVGIGPGGSGRLAAEDGDAKPTEKTPAPFKKSVKIGMVGIPGDLTAKMKALAELGYDGLELDAPNGPSADEVKKAIDASGIPIHGVVDNRHWKDTLSSPDEAVRTAGREALIAAIKASKSYGGTSVLLVPGVVNKEVDFTACWDRSLAEIRKVMPIAEENGIAILIENVWNNFIIRPEDMARYIDEIDSELFGSYFDIGNCVKFSPPETWIPTLGKRIKKLDVKGYGKAKGFGHTLLDGDIDWPAVVKELKKIGYEGWATAEVGGGDREYLGGLATMMNKALAG